ncbi:MAG: serine/threonine-protein kinase [Myxococcota bacterium]
MIGRTLDRYKIVAFIGSGAMARVYRATHTFLEQDYAIKILNGEIGSDRQLAERFRREALAASKIKHPNVGAVIDFGMTPEGLTFSVMELIEGQSLSQLLKKGPLEPGRASHIAREIASGLSAAHELGFVHRDLKPGNVMLARGEGQEIAKVVDFGLVRIGAADDPDASRLTQTGQIFGTPMYMAPEQISGTGVGPAADLYALGGILYEMLTGRPPFSGAFHLVLARQLSEKPAAIPSFDGLGELAMSLLEKQPSDRPASAGAVILKLEDLIREGATYIDRAPTPTPSRATPVAAARAAATTPMNSHRAAWVAGFGAGAIVIASAAWFIAAQARAPDLRPRAEAPVSREADDKAAPEATAEPASPVPLPPTTVEADDPEPSSPAAPSRGRPARVVVNRQRRPVSAPSVGPARGAQDHAFVDLERELSTLLAQRGLVLDDLSAFDAAGVERWKAWSAAGGPEPGAPVATTLDRLKSAARVAFIDAAFLSKKLDRVLAKMKRAAAKGVSIEDAEQRYVSLRRDLEKAQTPAELSLMATRISALEAELGRSAR